MQKLAPAIVVTLSVGASCAASRVSTEELSRYPESLNPRDGEGRTIYKASDGSCFVELPFAEPPTSGGMPRPQKAVECPPLMQHSTWAECAGEAILSTEDGSDCVCDTRGNPPPPTVPRVSCPR